MKSDIIKISRNEDNLMQILSETKRTAAYAGLDAKQNIKMRLIAEEFIGMMKELSQDFDGDFWIEQENLSFSFIAQIHINEVMDMQTKRKFIEISSDKKNAAAKGVMGKIRDVVENLLYPENAMYSASFISYQLESAVLLNDQWTLNRYKDAERDKAEPWDELEKSIIANLADDVIVSVKGNNVEIVIIKNFNKEN
jgi:hypothetical protein